MRMNTLTSLAAFFMTMTVASGANIVSNPGFELGETAWITNGWITADFRDGNPSGPTEVGTGCVGDECVETTWIYQDLVTEVGHNYTLSLLVLVDAGTPNQLRVSWDGVIALELIDQTLDSVWIPYVVDHLLATSPTTRLQLGARHDPSALFVDDISVTDEVPEPSGLTLVTSGLALVLGLVQHRRRSWSEPARAIRHCRRTASAE
jgi:hypothetical protein